MSRENVEVVRSIFDAWNRGDPDGLLEYMYPAVKIDYTAGALLGTDDSYEGHEGARKFWRDLTEPWSSLNLEIKQVRENEDKVAVAFTFEGTGREGIVVQRQAGGVYTFTDGLVSRFEAYADPAEALEAAGLSE